MTRHRGQGGDGGAGFSVRSIDYNRTVRTSKDVARAIRKGDRVLVVHGVDYNNKGKCNFDSAGKSELDTKLPAEATDPAACGVLR